MFCSLGIVSSAGQAANWVRKFTSRLGLVTIVTHVVSFAFVHNLSVLNGKYVYTKNPVFMIRRSLSSERIKQNGIEKINK